MKVQYKTEPERLQFFRELYEGARLAMRESDELFEKYMNQYRGSAQIDGSTEDALTVRNITYEIVESQISSAIPSPKVDPEYWNEKKARCAARVERLCRAMRDRLPLEELNDIDERYTYIYGGSVYYVEWDNEKIEGGASGGIRVHCISPRDFIPEPAIYSVADMDYCFIKFTTTKGELMRKYSLNDEELERLEVEYEFGTADGISDTVEVIVCYYRDERAEIGQFVFSGGLTLLDIPEYYRRKEKICKVCGENENSCVCGSKDYEMQTKLYENISRTYLDRRGVRLMPPITDSGVVIKDEEIIPYYSPKSFPIVIRKNTSREKSLFGQSDCEFIRPEQQAINKIESRILQKLLRAGITPIMPEDASISLNNSVFGQVIKMKPGESAAQYGKVDTTPNIAQDIAEAERLYDHVKRTLGISDAFQGIDMNSNESGIAKQLRISQATGRLESKKKMKHTAYAELDRIIFEHYLAFADEPRSLSYKDAFGRIHNDEFNRFDFIEYDIRSGEYYYDDAYLFGVDLNGGAEYQREAIWERNLENLKAGTLGDPASSTTLLRYWQAQEREHYPHARENVEYFRELVESEVSVYGQDVGQL